MSIITFQRGDRTALTKNFNRSEFQCSCGCGQQSVDTELAEKLQLIRDKVDRPLKITSGYRCITRNASKAVGGSPNSKHRYGMAADWRTENRSINPVALGILAQAVGFAASASTGTAVGLLSRRHPWHESDVALHHAGKVPQHDLQQVRASHHPTGLHRACKPQCHHYASEAPEAEG